MLKENKDFLIEEYKEVNANLRHYGNMRFAQLTLFIAITAAFLKIVIDSDLNNATIKVVLKIGGLFLTYIFWIMEERAADYWHHYKNRAIAIEEQLNFYQHRLYPKRRCTFFTATNAVRLFYFLCGFFWIYLLCV